MQEFLVRSLSDIFIELSCMISLIGVFIIEESSIYGFLEVITDASFMRCVELNFTFIITNEYFVWQWVVGNRQ